MLLIDIVPSTIDLNSIRRGVARTNGRCWIVSNSQKIRATELTNLLDQESFDIIPLDKGQLFFLTGNLQKNE